MSKWSELIPQEALQVCSFLTERCKQEREDGKAICPSQENISRALRLTPPEATKVVIVGQDPYHTPGVANGLAFSVSPFATIPPSLKNIYKEAANDLGWTDWPATGDLTEWAERGVLLLNATLSVYEHQPNSHSYWGWDKFTGAILDAAVRLPQPIVFMLWGANAIALKDRLILKAALPGERSGLIRQNMIKKYIICSSHPSPLSATKWCKGNPPFLGSKPFSTANEFLIEGGSTGIDWTL